MENRWGENEISDRLFSWAPKSLQTVTTDMKLKDACPLKTNFDKLRQHIKKQRPHFADKSSYSQSYGFSSSDVWMWELDCKEGWGLKNWCFSTVVLWKPLESPFDCKEIKQIHPKGNQLWIFIGRTDGEAEAVILRPPDGNSWLTGKDFDAGKDWGQEKKVVTDGEMVGWHHWLNGHEFEQTLGDSEGQGSLMCCSPWGCKELYMTEQLNHSNRILIGNTVQCRYSMCWSCCGCSGLRPLWSRVLIYALNQECREWAWRMELQDQRFRSLAQHNIPRN